MAAPEGAVLNQYAFPYANTIPGFYASLLVFAPTFRAYTGSPRSKDLPIPVRFGRCVGFVTTYRVKIVPPPPPPVQ